MGRVRRENRDFKRSLWKYEILEDLCGNIIDQVVSFNLHDEEAR